MCQILEEIDAENKTKLPVLRLHDDNRIDIVQSDDIGPLIVIGTHTNERSSRLGHYELLPWPRQNLPMN